MTDDDKFFRFMAGAAMFAISVFAGCTAYVNQTDDAAMAEMVAKGATPLHAACAVKGGTQICALAAVAK